MEIEGAGDGEVGRENGGEDGVEDVEAEESVLVSKGIVVASSWMRQVASGRVVFGATVVPKERRVEGEI